MRSEARYVGELAGDRFTRLLAEEWQRGGPLAAQESPLVCFPLKTEWEALQGLAEDVYPAPNFTSRTGVALNLPSAVEKLASFARAYRWGVVAQSSMGNLPHGSTGRPTALKRLVALRFGNHQSGRHAYAVYKASAVKEDWKPRSIMIWGPDLPPYAHVGSNGLKVYLADMANRSAEELTGWVAEIEKVRQASEAHQKRKMAVRRQIVKVADEGRFEAARAETRQEWAKADEQWRSKVADLQDGFFSSDEVEAMINRRRAHREAL